MPPVVAALTPIIGAFFATAVVNFAIAFAISTVISAFRPSRSGGYSAQALSDRTHVVRSAVQTRNIVYGECVTSGALALAHSTDKGSDKNKYLHLVVLLAAHEVESIDKIYFNDEEVGTLDGNGLVITGKYAKNTRVATSQSFTVSPGQEITLSQNIANVLSFTTSVQGFDSEGGWQTWNSLSLPYAITGANKITYQGDMAGIVVDVNYEYDRNDSLVRIKKFLGSPSQAASADLVAECSSVWSTNHRLRGIAYLYVRLEYDQTVFAGGIPNIRARLKGKKLYDPRTGLTAYSNNYALVAADYLTSEDGLGADSSDVDWASVSASANISDETITLVGGGTQKRYTVDGQVLTDHSPEENLRQLCTAGGGIVPVMIGGTFRVPVAAYAIPEIELTDDDLRGAIRVDPRVPRRDLFNAVKGTYVDDATFQATDFPIVRNGFYNLQDGGKEIPRDIGLPFTKHPATAQRLAKLILERARQPITVYFPCKVRGFQVAAWETVMLTIPKFGWNKKVFRVMKWSFGSDSGVDFILKEESAAAYDWANGSETVRDTAPDTNLPDPSVVEQIASITVVAGSNELAATRDGSVFSRLRASWPQLLSSSSYAGGRIEVQYKAVDETTWRDVAPLPTTATEVLITGVEDLTSYLVRVRMVSNRGAEGAWRTSSAIQVVGKSAAPSNVGAISVVFEPFGFRLSWGPIPDLDRDQYQVRTGGATFDTSTPIFTGSQLVTPTLKPIAAGITRYFVKAIDTSKNFSAVAAFVDVNVIAATVTDLAAAIQGQSVVLNWTGVPGSFAIDYYDVRYGASFAAGTQLDRRFTNSFTESVDYGGTRKYWVAAVDVAGNIGTPVSVDVVITPPAAVTITSETIDNNILLRWSDATQTLPIASYVVTKGGVYASSTPVGDNGNGRFASFFEQAAGVYTYWVVAIDTAGNAGPPTSIQATLQQPPDYVLRLDYTTDIGGLLYEFDVDGDAQGWVASGGSVAAADRKLLVTSSGTDPIITRDMTGAIIAGCEYPTIELALRRLAGSGWDNKCYFKTAGHDYNGSFYASGAGSNPAIGEYTVIRFDMSALTVGGSDWMASVIQGLRFDIGATSADIFEVDYIRLVPFKQSNIGKDLGKLYAPFTTDTWQNHFTSNGWSTPQDQINAGFPAYWQKSGSSAYYEEVTDYGTAIAATGVTATLSYTTLQGAVTVTPTISYKLNWSDAWTDVVGQPSFVISGSFRYVKVRYDFAASGGDDLIEISAVNLKLSLKQKNDGGMGNAVSTDVGGTVVNFNVPFTDVTGITVTAQSTTPVTAVYDFTDVPNPTSFKVLIFNSAGVRINCPFSWSAKGV